MESNNSRPENRTTAPVKKKNKIGSAILYIVTIIGISVILSIVLLFSVNDIFAFIKDTGHLTFTVPEDTTVAQLGSKLDKEGIINYSMLFKLYVKIRGKDEDVLAGDYELTPQMDYDTIVRNLRVVNKNGTVTVTIPEGYTIEQIRDTLIKRKVCSSVALDEALTQYRYKYDFLSDIPISSNWLEGYLFPDTYEFFQDSNAIEVINKMLDNFSRKYDKTISDGANSLGRSMNEIVTIASLVEREAQKEDEFATIAGVIYNRLNNSANFPYLQIDAAVQYALGHKEQLTAADLEIDSPYNTHKNRGLPPGPIANPGYNSLYAASHPEKHKYFYYVAMPDGSHLFASTLSEHNANIAKSKAAFAAAGN